MSDFEDSPPCIPPPPRPAEPLTLQAPGQDNEVALLLKALRQDVANLRLEVSSKLTRLDGHLHSLRGDVIIIGADVAEIKNDVRQLDAKVEQLADTVEAGHQILSGVRHLGESTFDMAKAIKAKLKADDEQEAEEEQSRRFGE